METLIAPTVNILVLVGFLVYVLRKPLKEFVQTRHVNCREELHKVTDLLKTAYEQFNEYTEKLKMIETEALSLKEQALQDAKYMKLRILSDARKNYARVISDAKLGCDSMFLEFRQELQKEFGNRVVGRAEKLLAERLTKDDCIRLGREFPRQVESAP
ncbi:MAG: ATP synthase F0 subunit B [Bdellovibrio sp.]|nr:ATP synthase F0 subunit B [Bdellovibrio sp.]